MSLDSISMKRAGSRLVVWGRGSQHGQACRTAGSSGSSLSGGRKRSGARPRPVPQYVKAPASPPRSWKWQLGDVNFSSGEADEGGQAGSLSGSRERGDGVGCSPQTGGARGGGQRVQTLPQPQPNGGDGLVGFPEGAPGTAASRAGSGTFPFRRVTQPASPPFPGVAN